MNPNNNNSPQLPNDKSNQPFNDSDSGYLPPAPQYPVQPTTGTPPSLNIQPDNVPVTSSNQMADSKTTHDRLRSILSTLSLFLLAPVIAILISMFVIQSYQVEGRSMETTLHDQDRLIVNKSPRTWSRLTGNSYIPSRGDIIIFNQSSIDFSETKPKQLIKRVIGLPSERVVVKDGRISVYNKDHPSGFNPDTSSDYQISSINTPGKVDVVIKPNEVFVCGDNRLNSEDSRYFGPVSADNIVGKLVLRVLPLNKGQLF